MTKSNFDVLSEVLFDREVKAADFKTMPGSAETVSREEAAGELLESMKRMGIVKNGALVHTD